MRLTEKLHENKRLVFMGCGFTSGGQESGSVFSAAVSKIQASKRYIECLSCFSQGVRSTVQLPLGPTFAPPEFTIHQ